MKVLFKIGDQVKIRSGKYKGQSGTINRVVLKSREAYVDGINIKKKAKDKQRYTQGSQDGNDEQNSENYKYIIHPVSFHKLQKLEGKEVVIEDVDDSKEKGKDKKNKEDKA